jgi:preprotein translocase subunit SecG
MFWFFVTLHIFLCVVLILVIILQPGKGGDLASTFGGGAASALFGPQGPTNLLQQVTSVVAMLFLVTSITLAWYSDRSKMANGDVEDALERRLQERAAEAEKPAAAEPAAGEEPLVVPVVPAGDGAPGPAEGDAP